MAAPSSYRPDIDGLRAIAVTIVVLFHLQAQSVGGGFIGVDIFFVISGFLITKIVLGDLRGDGFSLLTFYQRRVQRIFPALLVVASLLLLVAVLFLDPGAYASLGASTAAAMASGGNIYFYRNTGYFDAAAELAPLLHTWSLAVEEQFYVAWPLLLWAAARWLVPRFGERAYAAVMAVIIVASMAVAQLLLQVDPKAAFYLPFSRAWELAIGGMMAVLPDIGVFTLPHIAVEVVDAASLFVIAAFTVGMQSGPLASTLTAVAPVLAAAALVAPHAKPTLVLRLLSLQPLPYIGQLSYSWYLYHWPVIVLWRHYSTGQSAATIDASTGALLFFISVVAGWLSWRWVETPTRHVKWPKARVITVGYALSMIVAAVGAVVYAQRGFPSRLPATAQALASGEIMWAWKAPYALPGDSVWSARDQVGVPWAAAARRAVVFGDSHSKHLLPLLHLSGLRNNASLVQADGCPVFVAPGVTGVNRKGSMLPPTYGADCDRMLRELRDGLVAHPEIDTAIFAAAWVYMPGQVYMNNPDDPPRTPELAWKVMQQAFPRVIQWLRDELAAAGAPSRQFVIVGDNPQWTYGNPVDCLLQSASAMFRTPCTYDFSRLPLASTDQGTDDVLQRLSIPGVTVIPVLDNLCSPRDDTSTPARTCHAWLNGEFLYRDKDHFRRNLHPATIAALLDAGGYDAVWETGQHSI